MTSPTSADAQGGIDLEPVTPQHFWRLRGPKVDAFDRVLVRYLGWSLNAFQNCQLRRNPYTPCLLLTTVGRRSGQLIERVLPYHVHEDGFVVIGSNGGSEKDPGWVWNLRSEPRCWIWKDRAQLPVTAKELTGERRVEALQSVLAERPYAEDYEIRTSMHGRVMPVVLLTPQR